MNMDIWPQMAGDSEKCTSLSRLFGDLSHPLRLELVWHLLSDGEECVCNLARRCDVDQPTLSRHLRILKDHAVLTNRREGSNVLYRVSDPRVAPLLDSLGMLEPGRRGYFSAKEDS